MNLELLNIQVDLEIKSSIRQTEKSIDRSKLLFYADTSKRNGELKILPKKFRRVDLGNVENAMDLFLHEHWSLHDNPNERWPRLYTSIDPQEQEVFRLEEFPIKVDGLRVLSIKQAVRKNEQLIALCYRLATLDNS
ncbi:MAG: hypothetical protein A3B38_03465 [Candidatus Levybacteria bacterium RIFCSPLOWO2_01_FULL_36_13]|nr:MAG: hypothetical protein A2684_00400 [Candidatus Levybacteria bacterium RIFCSPHIGHO2_01_FULL_36_15b]OGH34198.1 MAG: hypothetical protein A3B38_03465 [Candidatus Levybacteria bacterium RIFCSPLOWO2_01_FULL_36_13]